MRKFIAILIGVFVFGCGGVDGPSKPDNLIPKDEMSEIMYDVFMLNAAKGINKRILEQNGLFPKEYIYEKYKIDSLQFESSNDYYSYDTKTYQEIIEKVKEKIEVEKTKNELLILKQDKKRDSVQKSKKLILLNDTIKIIKPKSYKKTFGGKKN